MGSSQKRSVHRVFVEEDGSSQKRTSEILQGLRRRVFKDRRRRGLQGLRRGLQGSSQKRSSRDFAEVFRDLRRRGRRWRGLQGHPWAASKKRIIGGSSGLASSHPTSQKRIVAGFQGLLGSSVVLRVLLRFLMVVLGFLRGVLGSSWDKGSSVELDSKGGLRRSSFRTLGFWNMLQHVITVSINYCSRYLKHVLSFLKMKLKQKLRKLLYVS